MWHGQFLLCIDGMKKAGKHEIISSLTERLSKDGFKTSLVEENGFPEFNKAYEYIAQVIPEPRIRMEMLGRARKNFWEQKVPEFAGSDILILNGGVYHDAADLPRLVHSEIGDYIAGAQEVIRYNTHLGIPSPDKTYFLFDDINILRQRYAAENKRVPLYHQLHQRQRKFCIFSEFFKSCKMINVNQNPVKTAEIMHSELARILPTLLRPPKV